MQNKEESEYWKGYIKRDIEAQQICKECKYRKKESKADSKELEEAIKYLKEENELQRWQLNSAFDNGFIHKDKIRKKLKELQKQYEEALEENSKKAFILKCQIEILEEVLGRSENSH